MSCNCSHCRRKGFLLTFVPSDSVTLVEGEAALTDCYFNKHNIAHRFCATCGCQPYGKGKGPGGQKVAAVNLRCVPSIDLEALTIKQVDGARF